MNLFGKIFKTTFLIIAIAEFISLCGYATPWINTLGFFTITLAMLAISIYKLEWGLLIVIAELLIGSKGYLFYFDLDSKSISIRIALWAILMIVWLVRTLINMLKTKKIALVFKNSSYSSYFFIFFFIVVFSVINGLINGSQLANIFFDVNGWLYLLLILPVYDLIVVKKENIAPAILQVFLAAAIWLTFKSLVLVFLFSHDIGDMIFVIYRWIRTTGVGEITLIQGGFYRIFFQSHIYLVMACLLFLAALTNSSLLTKIKIGNLSQRQKFLLLYSILAAIFAVNLINFSRSNWIGLVLSSFFLFLLIVYSKNWHQLFNFIWISISAAIFSALIIMGIVNFPLFHPLGGFNTAKLVSDRATAFSNEAGASSRWSLLPPLWQQITNSPFIGQGFGATVTYKTSDPRILESNPGGLYTTYAFEWGWLDIWLKLGLIGLLIYLALILKIYFIDVYKIVKAASPDFLNNTMAVTSVLLSLGVVVLMAVSVFSPYLNHPLGFGYLVISSAIIEKISHSKK